MHSFFLSFCSLAFAPYLMPGAAVPVPAAPPSAPDTAAIDAVVNAYMADKGVSGLSLAIAKAGQQVFAKGYGTTGEATPTMPLRAVDAHTRFRLASLSKSITAVAVMKLRDDGAFGAEGLEKTVFGSGAVFGDR